MGLLRRSTNVSHEASCDCNRCRSLSQSPGSHSPLPFRTQRNFFSARVNKTSQQDAQVKSERLNTFKRMLEQERTLLDHTENEYLNNPSEKLQKDINGIKTRISVLEKQLTKAANNMIQNKAGGSNNQQSSTSAHLPVYTATEGQHASASDHTNMNEEFQPIPEEKKNVKATDVKRPWLPQGISHHRQRSSPETFTRINNQSPTAGVKRNNSDAQAKEVARQKVRDGKVNVVEPLNRDKKQKKDIEAIGRTKSLPGETMDPEFEDGEAATSKMLGMEAVTPMEGVVETSLIESDHARVMTDTADMPQFHMPTVVQPEMFNAPAVSELHSLHAPGPTPQGQKNIMCMDEDDFQSDNEPVPPVPPELEDHGPFNDLEQLQKKSAHMAVFLHYLISNSDPSSLFFYLVTDSYASGNLRDMKKWVYDIFSTFLGSGGPLRIQMSESLVNNIEHTINTQQNNEEAMRNVFIAARNLAKEEVDDLLADFRHKRALGLGSIFGDQYLTNEDMDKAQELKIVESTLLPHLDRLTTSEAEKEPKNQALAAALNTFMKQAGVKNQTSSALERAPSFMTKDRRGPLKFPRSTKKQSVKGHVFQENQYLNTTFCNQCNGLLWGIGYQGLQCTYCEFNIHKSGPCLEHITTECPGKKKKKEKDKEHRRTRMNFPNVVANNQGKDDSKSTANPISPTSNVIHMKGDNEELAQMKQEMHNAQVAKNIDVSNMVDQFEKQDNLSVSADSGISSLASLDNQTQGDDHREVSKQPKQKRNIIKRSASLKSKKPSPTSLESEHHKKKKNFIKRSSSLKLKGEEKKEGRRINENKRSRSIEPGSHTKSIEISDVDMDGQTVAAVLSPSQASSSSSLSTNRSQDSPRTSLEHLSRAVEEDDSDIEAEANTPNWQKMIDKDIVRKLKPKEVKRQEVINELFHTEKTHVRSLKVLRKVFYLPMLDQEIVGLTRETINFIFPNIDEMIEIHGTLNNAMKREKRTSHIIQEVSQILLERFNGEAGETMKRVCAVFCQNQSIAMEHLKKLVKKEKEKEKDKKEGSLSRFMDEAEGNPLCRRLPLPGIVATGYQRLTKYPLLIENLLKYTPPKSPEYERLGRALDKSKEILSYVNQAVKESENRFRLVDYDSRMDRTPLDKSNNPLVTDYKNFSLAQYKMIHDGVLTWKVNRNKSIEVQVLLLEELIVLLSKQDEKLVLKLHSTTNQAREELKTHSPIIKLSTVLCRPVATNKKAFFLVSTSSAAGPQIYELCTNSSQERQSWMDVIHTTQETERKQSKGGRRNARITPNPRPLPPELHPVYEETSKPAEKPEINDPPEVVNNVVIAPQPEVVTLNNSSDTKSDSESTEDIRTALEKSINQVPGEEASISERLQSSLHIVNRSIPVLDEAVGESTENVLLVKALNLLSKQLAELNEKRHLEELEMKKLKEENSNLQSDYDELKAERRQLTGELTVMKHELGNLQPDPLQNNPGSVDSIPNTVDEDRLMTDKQRNRQSYSGDSSATESEDSKTVESSDPEEATVVVDDENKSLNEQDSDVPVTPNEMVQPEIFHADTQLVKPVVNEQLLELQSAAGLPSERTENEESAVCVPEALVTEDIANGLEELKISESNQDYENGNEKVGVGVEDECAEEENNVDAVGDEANSEVQKLNAAVDVNSNPNVSTESVSQDDTISEEGETENAPVTVDADTKDSSLGDADLTTQEFEASDEHQTLDELVSSTKEEPDSHPCLIEVVDNDIPNAEDIVSSVEEKTQDNVELTPEEEQKLQTIKSDVIPTTVLTTVPEQTQLDSREGGSRPVSLISEDSASSDVLISGSTEEIEDTTDAGRPGDRNSQGSDDVSNDNEKHCMLS
ncbi:rho guanine nucleotide exchange factor 12-like isoform X1 [Lytechinus variegatus]|uniref:rho guanine nucleotide exchange factor 12-like isoform X1 n=2 Tax=Lytechinus variegatus TaxID=7654 RepID=UPI001BB0D8F1|nr:rho guanine nucleotide exchange factor 12-like isoform X1 [Lytechinus variegatus]